MARRKLGAGDSVTRAKIIGAAEAIMREKGYAFVTSRRVGAQAELNAPLVHYYFRTMDDLFLALFREVATRMEQKHTACMESDKPLSCLWSMLSDPAELVIFNEFMALAHHSKIIQEEIVALGNRMRARQTKLLNEIFERKGIVHEYWSPMAIGIIANAAARTITFEHAMGLTAGNNEMVAAVKKYIQMLED